jgi:hypothetical protein
MKIPGLDGEWELYTGDITLSDRNDDLRVLKRIPEKSELQKWIESKIIGMGNEYTLGLSLGKVEGFRKAIEVLEESNHMCAENIVPILKAYCGDK